MPDKENNQTKSKGIVSGSVRKKANPIFWAAGLILVAGIVVATLVIMSGSSDISEQQLEDELDGPAEETFVDKSTERQAYIDMIDQQGGIPSDFNQKNLERLLNILEEEGENPTTDTLSAIGYTYEQLNDAENAIKYYELTIENAETQDEKDTYQTFINRIRGAGNESN